MLIILDKQHINIYESRISFCFQQVYSLHVLCIDFHFNYLQVTLLTYIHVHVFYTIHIPNIYRCTFPQLPTCFLLHACSNTALSSVRSPIELFFFYITFNNELKIYSVLSNYTNGFTTTAV